jgi:hypothetical protein
MSEYEFTISLRIRHPSIEPHTITKTLGIEPQHIWKAGDARRSSAGGTRGQLSGELLDSPIDAGAGAVLWSVFCRKRRAADSRPVAQISRIP